MYMRTWEVYTKDTCIWGHEKCIQKTCIWGYEKCKDLSDIERYVILSFDEIKIQSDFVFDKHSGEIIGFVDVVENDLNFATTDDLATHVLSLNVRSFLGDVKFNFAFLRLTVW